MNKKGIMIPVMTILGLIVLLYAAFSVYSGENKAATEKIGKLQLDIIELQQDAEGRLFYLDQLVKHSAIKSSNDLKNEKFASNNAFINAFGNKFSTEFESNIRLSYFEVPFDYKFEYQYENDTIKIKADSRKEIVLKKEFVTYGFEHDFTYEVVHKLTENAENKQLFGK